VQFVLSFIEDYGLTQIVDFPTRGQNILDIFATNHPSLVTACKPVLAGNKCMTMRQL